jgi:hypothetical protein
LQDGNVPTWKSVELRLKQKAATILKKREHREQDYHSQDLATDTSRREANPDAS